MADAKGKGKAGLCTKHNSDSEEEEDHRGVDLGLSLEKLNLGRRKKLLIMGLGGFLCHRVFRYDRSKFPKSRSSPDASYGSFHVYKRPYCEEFVKFCLERFEVGIWSSAREWYMNNALDCITIGLEGKLLFAWSAQELGSKTWRDLEKKEKPIFLKELKKLWKGNGDGFLRLPKQTQFSSSNTLLIDNDPYKSLLNPAYSAIFPNEYKADDVNDEALGAASDLRVYLDQVASADDVPGFVKQHPFGKPAISPRHPHWDFYSKIIRAYE